jgi:hypothetical protein
MKYFSLIILSILGFSFNAAGQYADKAEAVSVINTILKKSTNPASLEMNDIGTVKLYDLEYTDIIYVFNIHEVELIEYEAELRQHRIKFVCLNAKKCFYCEKNNGVGIFHYLEVNNEEEGLELVLALGYLKKL